MTGRSLKGVGSYRKIGAAAISIAVFLLIWQLAVMFTDVGIVMVGPVEVIGRFFVSMVEPIGHDTIQMHILWSLSRVMTGFMLGSVLGIVLGILMGWFRPMNALFRPLYEIIRPIPPIAWIPLSIVWFGIGEPSKYFIIFLAAFSAITMNAFAGDCRSRSALPGPPSSQLRWSGPRRESAGSSSAVRIPTAPSRSWSASWPSA